MNVEMPDEVTIPTETLAELMALSYAQGSREDKDERGMEIILKYSDMLLAGHCAWDEDQITEFNEMFGVELHGIETRMEIGQPLDL